jgi:hypothetical protein
MTGLVDKCRGVPVPLPISFRGMGESLRTDNDDGARW